MIGSVRHPEWSEILEPERRGLELRPPCDESTLKVAASRLGQSLPTSLAGFYGHTDGFYDTSAEYEYAWSLDRLVNDNLESRNDDFPLPSDILGFGGDGAGGWFCLWADGRDTSVFHFNWIDYERFLLAPDLTQFWRGWLDGEITA
jgi:hypothetical protein